MGYLEIVLGRSVEREKYCGSHRDRRNLQFHCDKISKNRLDYFEIFVCPAEFWAKTSLFRLLLVPQLFTHDGKSIATHSEIFDTEILWKSSWSLFILDCLRWEDVQKSWNSFLYDYLVYHISVYNDDFLVCRAGAAGVFIRCILFSFQISSLPSHSYSVRIDSEYQSIDINY
jgi:hypothetical protein